MADGFKFPDTRVAGLSIGSALELKKMVEKTLGGSLDFSGAFGASQFVLRDQMRALDSVTNTSRVLESLSSAVRGVEYLRFLTDDYGILKPYDIASITRSLGVSSDAFSALTIRREMLPESVRAQMDQITSFNKYLRTMPDLTAAFQPPRVSQMLSSLEAMKVYQEAISGLPAWLKPISELQAIQPSWEIAANLGIAGFGTPSMVYDAVHKMYAVRQETVGFEAVVQMLEAADQPEDELTDRILTVLRTYAAAIIDALDHTKDWFRRQGLLATLGFLITLLTFYDTHKSRLATEEQLNLAKQTPSAIGEIQKHQDELTQIMSRFLEESSARKDARVLTRAVPLRATPDAKGMVLRHLYPDDRVRVLDVKDSWAHIEVYEYSSEQTQTGWINRRVLRLPQQ
jgi:hypothetical protein